MIIMIRRLLLLLLVFSACQTRTSESALLLDEIDGPSGVVYIYMPRNVRFRPGDRAEEELFINSVSLGSIRPGYSIGFRFAPGFLDISTMGLVQERLQRRFFLEEGAVLFIAMEKGMNYRTYGYLFYLKDAEEGRNALRRTRFSEVFPGAQNED